MRAPQPTPSRFRLFCDGLLRFITKRFALCASKNVAPDSESTDAGSSSPRASILPTESADARPVSLARAGLRHEWQQASQKQNYAAHNLPFRKSTTSLAGTICASASRRPLYSSWPSLRPRSPTLVSYFCGSDSMKSCN